MNPTSDDNKISEVVREVEKIAIEPSNHSHKPGTVIDAQGNAIKLGEKADGIEIVYGSAIELPTNLSPLKDGPEIRPMSVSPLNTVEGLTYSCSKCGKSGSIKYYLHTNDNGQPLDTDALMGHHCEHCASTLTASPDPSL